MSIQQYFPVQDVLILNIDHTLRMGITKIALMRRSIVNLVFIQGVLDFIGEDAC